MGFGPWLMHSGYLKRKCSQTGSSLVVIELHNNLLATQWYAVRAKSMLINKHLSTQSFWMDSVMSPQCAGSRWHSKAQITAASSLLPYTYHQRRGKESNSIKFWIVILLDVQYLWIVSQWTPEAQSQIPVQKWIPLAHELN